VPGIVGDRDVFGAWVVMADVLGDCEQRHNRRQDHGHRLVSAAGQMGGQIVPLSFEEVSEQPLDGEGVICCCKR
jgi:hypothetical protein